MCVAQVGNDVTYRASRVFLIRGGRNPRVGKPQIRGAGGPADTPALEPPAHARPAEPPP